MLDAVALTVLLNYALEIGKIDGRISDIGAQTGCPTVCAGANHTRYANEQGPTILGRTSGGARAFQRWSSPAFPARCALAAGGIYLIVTAPSAQETSAPSAAIVPMFGPGLQGLSFTGRF